MDRNIRIAFSIVISIVLVIVLAAVLMLYAMDIGGNHYTEFEAFGRRGYEATGMIGALIGLAIGITAAFFIIKASLRP